MQEIQNKERISGSNRAAINGQKIQQAALLNSVASVKTPVPLDTGEAHYSQAKTDMGFAVTEDEDFNAHLLEGFTKDDSSDDQAPESGDEIEVESDEGQGQQKKKRRE